MAPESRRPPAWGEPAPVYDSVDEGVGAGESIPATGDLGPDGSTNLEVADQGRDQGRDTADENTGPSSGGWQTVAPVVVSENGARPTNGGRPGAPGLGAHYATVGYRREHRVLRGIRSGVALTVIALALGVAAAATLGVIVWLIAMAIHHAAAN